MCTYADITDAGCSLDQTTRIHAEVSLPDAPGSQSWHEIGRPQVHGYDLLGVAFVDALHFVSIADEKVARVFAAPQEFVDVVHNLGVADVKAYAVMTSCCLAVSRLDAHEDIGGTAEGCDRPAFGPVQQGRVGS